jgi:hypothetical protein
MNMQILRNRTKVTAIMFILILTIATVITVAPIAFGQIGQPEINMTAVVGIPLDRYIPLIEVNDPILIHGILYPRPAFSGGEFGDVYHDVEFTFFKPDGTNETIVKDTNTRAEIWFEYIPDQVGEWEVEMYWAGDEFREEEDDSVSWTVVSTPQPSILKVIQTYSHASTAPKDLIGQGQYIYIVGFVTPPPCLSGPIYYDLTFTITKPDGSTDTVVRDSNSEASTSFGYLCDQTGEWSVTMSYGGDQIHTSSVSQPWTWTVQAEPVPLPPQQPLPDYQWEYPISAEYYEWYQIAGSWPQNRYNLAHTNFNPYSKGPETPHIIWKRQMDASGIVGELGWSGLFTGGPIPVAVYGRLYYIARTYEENTQIPVLVCLDLFTGEELFRNRLRGTGSGGSLYVEFEQRVKVDPKLGIRPSGVVSLWAVGGGGIREIDPWDGRTIYYNDDFPSGVYHDGALYFESYNATSGEHPDDVMTKWDTRFKEVLWVNEVSDGWDYIWEDIIMEGFQGRGQNPFGQQIKCWNATTGELFLEGPYLEPYSTESGGRTSVEYGKWYFHSSTTLSVHAVSLLTGEMLWTSEPNEAPWGIFGSYVTANGYGNYYQGTWDGYLSCYDAETGATKWRTYLDDNPEMSTGSNTPWGQPIIADGKVYITSSQHTLPTPVPRGQKLYCIDAHNGDKLWEIPFVGSFGSEGGISSGVMFRNNYYDGCLYAFGRGPSATTVSALPKVIANGDSVLIEGTVTDQSPGAMGTPAIADEDQSEWMQYLYQNKPMPTDVTGVSVLLQAMRSDGTVFEIGWATSDMMGHYEYLWTPSDQDTYKILATFGGSKSYYMSSAETAVGVTAAPASQEFPDVPTAAEIAQATINRLPPYPTMPDVPTAAEVAQETETVLEIPETPAFLTIDLVILVVAAIGVVIGLLAYMTLRKQ